MARQGHAVPVEQPDRLGLGHAGTQAREQAPDAVRRLAGRVLEDRELVHVVDHPQAVGGVDHEVVGVLDEPRRTGERPQRVGDERRSLDPRAVRVGLPAEDADAAAAADPLPRQDLAQRSRAVSRLGWQAEVLEQVPPHRQRRGPGGAPALVAHQHRGRVVRTRARGAPPRSAGRTRSGTRGSRCARGRRTPPAGRSRARSARSRRALTRRP